MNLTLTRRGDYVVRAAVCLASVWQGEADERAPTGYRKIRDVAREVSIPDSYTPQVLGLLVRAGLAESKAGPGGGYRLSRRPAAISMLDVVQAAEGTLAQGRCILRGEPCRWEESCAVHPTWFAASEAFQSVLRTTTLAQVAAEDRALAARRPAGSDVLTGAG